MKYFTADCHFGHAAILGMTGRDSFSSIEDWDKHLLDVINSSVGKKDTLFVLGDFTCGADPAKYRNKFKCKNIWFIVGNHDKSLKRLQEVFGSRNVRHVMETKVCGIPTWLSHYAHAYWPKSHRGSYHLYGHTHFARESTLHAALPGRKSMDVGVDSAIQHLGMYAPFSEEYIHEYLKIAPGHDLPSFYYEYDFNRRNNA